MQCQSEAKPAQPHNVLDLNGITWPTACYTEDEDNHFFIIGDWGGYGYPVRTFNNRPTTIGTIDTHAQSYVAYKINELAPALRPKFFVNVGDNFYPGGISSPGTCNATTDRVDAAGSITFTDVYEEIYHGDGVDGVEWWGVLGNHDYGGYEYNVHWDQNIFYTWGAGNRWVTPALYWRRTAQFRNFSVDFFFLDTNKVDTFGAPVDESGHNICSSLHNVVNATCPGTTMVSPATCWTFFDDLWNAQKPWLEKHLGESTADWQIIVSHYPATYEPLLQYWQELFPKYGIDMYISGHTHLQQLNYNYDIFGETPYIISGGGGGITSEILPTDSGEDDAYGFMDVTISAENIKVVQYSHGGLDHKTIIRNTTLISPRLPSFITV